MLDLSNLLTSISDELPCGERQNNSSLYFEMLEAKGGGERQSFSGDGTGDGEKDDTDWKLVKRTAIELLKNSHDLEIAVQLTISLLHTDGFSGLASGLSLIRQLLEQYWDCLHPELDMDFPDQPDEQAFERISLLSDLGGVALKLSVRKHPVIAHNVLGKFCLNEIQAAYSDNPPEDAPKSEHVDGAFIEVGEDVVKETKEAISTSIIEAETIESFFKEKAGPASYPDLSALRSTLREIDHILAGKVQDEELEVVANDETSAEETTISNSAQNTPKFNAGQINNRDDVAKALDKVCEYYQKHEPGSPIPLLIQRAKRLIDKDFLEILEDLSPDGVNQASNILGKANE